MKDPGWGCLRAEFAAKEKDSDNDYYIVVNALRDNKIYYNNNIIL
jgi:hypothetical protein